MGTIVTIGETLVEMVATEMGQKFDESGVFAGPFPSGAPAIFADQASRCGSDVNFISAVGDDGFGRINLNRLNDAGVNTEFMRVDQENVTGSAFVTYTDDGNRDFIFNIVKSASGYISERDVHDRVFDDCSYFHIMGSSVYNHSIQAAVEACLEIIVRRDIKISFDPNIRKEILDNPTKLDFLKKILSYADIIQASVEELSYLLGSTGESELIRDIFANHKASIIVVKRGSVGSTVYTRDNQIDVAPYKVEEVDPTGAGDCFAGTLISCINQGMSIDMAADYASAAGAIAVTKQGPMEGNTDLNGIVAFIQDDKRKL
ncbi:sugar kinase [Erysipelothrix sp. HDW6C]|uniref:sugar kinase n=1 Tax=Erysipelothrix sp. HDW6C TaxID=2714930 RepID=UPI00140E7F73|nr:sugar kinase [Erysipelothrix sp. HDW6C]QIK70669.1 sugar kinase [Erysipelothrix sp. HDW6C]